MQILITILVILVILASILFVGVLFAVGMLVLSNFGLLVRARTTGIELGIFRLIGLRLRRLDPEMITDSLITLRKNGLQVSFDELESHILAGGNLRSVVEAAVRAHKGNLNITFRQICAIDLAGRNVLRAIQACIEPVIIQIPSDPNQKYIIGVAKNGIQLGINVKVTARANVERLIGGASEATIEARVGQGIVTAIGMAEQHTEILENPNRICEVILNRGLDANTAFEIVSVDVGDIEVFENIGAKLAEAQASADRLIAQAKAEARRAMAAASQQENRARVREMKALETLSQAEVPLELAKAYQNGKIALSHRPAYSVMQRVPWQLPSEKS